MILPLFSFLLFCIQASQAIICDAGAYFNPNQQSCEYCLKGTYSDTPGRVGGCSRCPAGSRVKNPSYYGNTECVACSAGTYEVNGMECHYCPYGTYSNITGATEGTCKKCPAGYRVKDPSYYGNTECVACSAGTYEVDGRECHYCPYGTYSNITGATEGTCKKCPAGYRVKNPSYYGNTECVACPAGTYEVNGRECYYCPYGTYSNVIGATEGTCKKCPAGYRVKDPSYYGNTECVACPAGTYEVNGKECYYCPLGTYSSMIGASGPQSCLPCPSGSVARSTGSTQCTLCQPGEYELNRTSCPYCAQGTYSSTAGSAVCTSCPAGSKTPYWNGNTGCVKCKPGEYERDRVGCPDCPVGTYSSTEGSTQCTPCPAGSKTLYWSGNTGCVKCKPGEYERDRVGCPDCPAGTYSSTEGSTQCTPCPAGWKTPLDYANTKCVQCQAGTYEVDRKSCFSCPEGKYSSPGSSNFSSCLPCPAGSIVNSEKTGCTQCPVGTYSANGVKCTYCPAGTYSDVIGATSCKVCDTGYMTNPNYIGYTKCTPCPPGTSEHDHTACYYCLGGTYSPGAISGCLACPPGTISSNTASKCTPCPAGTYEDSRRSCYYCPAGSHSLPGSVQCTKNFIPAVIERPVNWTRLEITLNNTVDFLEGAVNGLCMEDIGEKVERLENVGDAVGDIWDAWHNVSWTNMSSLKSAIIESSNATMDILEVVEDWTPLSSKRMLQTFIVFAAPPLTPLVLAYEFGAFTYRLGENIKDVTAEIKEIHEGVQNGNFTQAGHGLGSLVKTALELKDLHRELQEEMK